MFTLLKCWKEKKLFEFRVMGFFRSVYVNVYCFACSCIAGGESDVRNLEEK